MLGYNFKLKKHGLRASRIGPHNYIKYVIVYIKYDVGIGKYISPMNVPCPEFRFF